jgi:hypothetical protein
MDAGAGFLTHSGWAIAVTAGLDGGGHLTILDRRRVVLIDDDLPRQAYHAAAACTPAEAEALVAKVDASIVARSQGAVRDVLAASDDVTIVAVAVVGQPRPIPDVAAVLRSHPLMHASEGEQYRRGVAEAVKALGPPVLRIDASDLERRVVESLHWTPERVRRELAAVRATIGAPWQSDHKKAALAAVAALHREDGHSRARVMA